ncbi:DUF3265 domain-containing protein [Vibrio furnissii]|nr:DUF3265 domain-containing protein [Vibrio furnissii]
MSAHITKCSRGIPYAWHFNYAFVLVAKLVCGRVGLASITP